jgi:hypothetical protein
MDARKAEIKLLNKVAREVNNNLIAEWVAQGHHLTGAWESSMKGTIITSPDSVAVIGTMNYYGAILEDGVAPNRIPYGGRSASGGTSKYIQGLVSYWKKRGLDEREAIRAAFATANKHKKEGMPTKGSYAFSKTGSRSKFINTVDKAMSPEIDRMMSDGLDDIVDRKYREEKSETI